MPAGWVLAPARQRRHARFQTHPRRPRFAPAGGLVPGASGPDMRVLIVSHHALPHVGGIESLVDLEARALERAGHEVLLVTSRASAATVGPTPVYSARVSAVRVRAWHVLESRCGLPYPLFSPRVVPELWKAARGADLVHVHGFVYPTTLPALLFARRLRRFSILTEHGGLQQFASVWKTCALWTAVQSVGRLAARLANDLVTFNLRIAHLLESLSSQRVRFVPNPVDHSLFRPPTAAERRDARRRLGWLDPNPRVLFVGRLIPEKGVALLLELAASGFRVAFCGPADRQVQQQIERTGAQYWGVQKREHLAAFYYAADVLALPSSREGFPLAAQEAMACQLPVVLGDDPGFAPYRRWPGLILCRPTPREVRLAVEKALAIRHVLAEPEVQALADQLAPDPDTWLSVLYANHLRTPARAAPSETRRPSCLRMPELP